MSIYVTGSLFVVISLLLAIMCIIRCSIIFTHSKKALDYISMQDNSEHLHKIYNPVARYHKNFWNLKKWTYKQTFPGLED